MACEFGVVAATQEAPQAEYEHADIDKDKKPARLQCPDWLLSL
jgi:hypothetical protein